MIPLGPPPVVPEPEAPQAPARPPTSAEVEKLILPKWQCPKRQRDVRVPRYTSMQSAKAAPRLPKGKERASETSQAAPLEPPLASPPTDVASSSSSIPPLASHQPVLSSGLNGLLTKLSYTNLCPIFFLENQTASNKNQSPFQLLLADFVSHGSERLLLSPSKH